MSRKEEIQNLEKRMRFLFNLPMAKMSDDVVYQYNLLESRWKRLSYGH